MLSELQEQIFETSMTKKGLTLDLKFKTIYYSINDGAPTKEIISFFEFLEKGSCNSSEEHEAWEKHQALRVKVVGTTIMFQHPEEMFDFLTIAGHIEKARTFKVELRTTVELIHEVEVLAIDEVMAENLAREKDKVTYETFESLADGWEYDGVDRIEVDSIEEE